MPYGRPQPAGAPLDKEFKVLKAIVITQGDFNGGIFKVLQRSTGRICLEKRFQAQHVVQGIARKEMLILRSLRHRNVSEYIDAFEMPRPIPRASIYMDYCDEGSLDDTLTQFKNIEVGLGEEFIWSVFVELANAVGYLQHGIQDTARRGPPVPGWRKMYVYDSNLSSKVAILYLTANFFNFHATSVHRDIAPRNIFLKKTLARPFSVIVLGDFGCASVGEWDGDRVRGNYIGHDAYWNPPETPLNGPPSDIWAIGGIIQAMMRLDGDAVRYGPLVHGHRMYKGHDPRYSLQLNKSVEAFMSQDWRYRPRIRDYAPRLRELRFEVTGREWDYKGLVIA